MSLAHGTIRQARLVLIAEDDEEVRATYVQVLSDSGFRVIETGSAVGVVEMTRAREPDVIVLGWRLGGVPGALSRSAVTAVRALGAPWSSTPVVLFSGARDGERIARELGVHHCPKPCDIDKLARTILAAAASREPQRPALARTSAPAPPLLTAAEPTLRRSTL